VLFLAGVEAVEAGFGAGVALLAEMGGLEAGVAAFLMAGVLGAVDAGTGFLVLAGVLVDGVASFTGVGADFAGVLVAAAAGVVFCLTAGGAAFFVPIGVRVAAGFAAGVVVDAGLPIFAGAALAGAGVVLAGAAVFVEAIGRGFLVPIAVLAFAGVGFDFVAAGVFFAPSAIFATPPKCHIVK